MQKLRQDFVDSCRRKSKRTESERIDNCKQIHERKVRIQRVRKSTSKITHFNFNASPRHSEIDACQNNSGKFREAAEFCFVFFLPPATHTKTMQNLCIWCSHLPRSNREKKTSDDFLYEHIKTAQKMGLFDSCVRASTSKMNAKQSTRKSQRQRECHSQRKFSWTLNSIISFLFV